MTTTNHKRISKRLSLILRHEPQSVGLQLDDNGWVAVDALIAALRARGTRIDRDLLNDVVRTNPKKRFEFDATQHLIRARQGHPVNVDLGYTPTTPPEFLYHGTPERFLPSILNEGLEKMQRHDVHLSTNVPLMLEVARRRGAAALLRIDALRMHAAGHLFYRTENDVWLTNQVPPEYITPIHPETLNPIP